MKKILFITAGIAFLIIGAHSAHASTNITATSNLHWAWNDGLGWIDFYNPNTVTVTSAVVQGYASSSAGYISLDCNTSPTGNICSPGNGNYQVVNDGAGNLSGWAWNDVIGWISLWCGNPGGSGCGVSSYRVTIDSGGNFQGYAWNDLVGWLDFNCDNISNPNPGSCAASNFEVQTAWVATSTSGTLDSATYDTGIPAGAQFNAITWQGSLPVNTSIAFKFAVSNSSSGPWNFTGPGGTTSTADAWVGGNPGIAVPFSTYAAYQNFRYFRYRVILNSNVTQTATPRVDDVIVSWSP